MNRPSVRTLKSGWMNSDPFPSSCKPTWWSHSQEEKQESPCWVLFPLLRSSSIGPANPACDDGWVICPMEMEVLLAEEGELDAGQTKTPDVLGTSSCRAGRSRAWRQNIGFMTSPVPRLVSYVSWNYLVMLSFWWVMQISLCENSLPKAQGAYSRVWTLPAGTAALTCCIFCSVCSCLSRGQVAMNVEFCSLSLPVFKWSRPENAIVSCGEEGMYIPTSSSW